MRKISFLLLVIISVTATALAGNELRLIKARGTVNTNEIGGMGLCVFSLWDTPQGSPVGSDGSFVTVISGSRPQKLSVKDNKTMTRALAIALPENSQEITFDATSTAAAMLFQDSVLLRNFSEVDALFLVMANKVSFQELALFLKENLPLKSLEELADGTECRALLEKCSDEVFKEDQSAIRNSLHKAKNVLEKLLEEE